MCRAAVKIRTAPSRARTGWNRVDSAVFVLRRREEEVVMLCCCEGGSEPGSFRFEYTSCTVVGSGCCGRRWNWTEDQKVTKKIEHHIVRNRREVIPGKEE